ncbi:MAG: NAD(P)-dependent oxidoreductase [Actinomycetales bacterium]
MGERIAFLGTGIMGGAMARRLADAGQDIAVWNRTLDKARPLADAGATVAASVADAVRGRTLLVTMLADADVTAAALGNGDALAGLAPDALWLQMATVGVAGEQRLRGLAEAAGVGYLDAPVSGTKQPAEQGALTVLASGPEDLRARAETVFSVVGSTTVWAGEAGAGSRLKLVVNTWLLGLLGALADSIRLSELLGLDPAGFLAAIEGGPLFTPYAKLKGGAMIAGEYPAAFPLSMASKDAQLVVEAAHDAGGDLPVADALAGLFQRAAALDGGELGRADMAAVVEALRRA